MEINWETLGLIEKIIPGHMAIYRIHDNGVETLYRSPELHVLNGMTEEEYLEVTNEDASKIVLPDDLPGLMNVVKKCVVTGNPAEYYYRVQHKKRGFDWVHVHAKMAGEMDATPVIICMFTNAAVETDIYQELLDHSDSMIYVTDCFNYDILYANRGAKAFSGISDRFLGYKCFEYVWQEKQPCDDCFIRSTTQGEIQQSEWHDETTNRWYKLSGKRVMWCGHDAFINYIDDITQTKLLQQQIVKNEQRYELAVDGARLGVWEYHIKEHRIDHLSNGFAQFNLNSSITNVPESIMVYFREEEQDKLRDLFHRIEAGVPIVEDEFWVHWPNIAPRCYRAVFSVVKDQQGEPVIAYGLGQNITLQKIVEKNYNRSMRNLMTVNPAALSTYFLNLTQNTFVNMHGMSSFVYSQLTDTTVDNIFETIAGLIADKQESQEFRSMFDRQTFIRQFNEGKTRFSLRYRRRDGLNPAIWVTAYANLLQNPETDDIEAIVSSVNSEERMLECQIMQKVADNCYDMLLLVNVGKQTLQVRSKSSQFSGEHQWLYMTEKDTYDYYFIIDKMVREWLYPADEKIFRECADLDNLLRQLADKPNYEFSIRGYKRDGGICSKRLQYCWLDDTSKEQLLCEIFDITPIYEAHQSQLRQEQQLRETAVRENEMKSRYISDVSHDMRTPLNGIMGYIKLALAEKNTGQAREYLEKAQKSSEILLQLINDTLDLNKLENGTLTFRDETVYVRDLIDQVLITIRPLMDAKNLHFIVRYKADDTLIITDTMRINGIFQNLLSNAAKFTPAGGRVELLVEQESITDSKIIYKIIVRDNGIGMSRNFLKRIYEPFTQERTKETARIGGSGLGLSIVKKLLEILGGDIKVKSKMGKGSEFTLTIPFPLGKKELVKGSARPLLEMQNHRFTGKEILLCDDNEMNREIASAILQSEGIHVTSAIDGEECVQTFCASETDEFDLILMDIRMPVMNGYEATRAIRRLTRPDAKKIPIVAMSADAYPEDIKKSLNAGMNAHIAKPIDTEKMLLTIYQLICC